MAKIISNAFTATVAVVLSLAVFTPAGGRARAQAASGPSARLIAAPSIGLPGEVDSNSPAVWERVAGRVQLFVFTSNGEATRHTGGSPARLRNVGTVAFVNPPGHGVWFEAIVADVDGTWYGYYHNEIPSLVCEDDPRVAPRIGAARSRDFGATWQDLGTVLEAPQSSHDCSSTNMYFVGGVGDFSVVPDADGQYLYFFFSQYPSRESLQGVAVACLAWADRDRPSGKITVWSDQVWLPASRIFVDDTVRYFYPEGTPIYPVREGWHAGDSVDAFWGPSVHWNTYLEQYVMLLNRAQNSAWSQEGVYIAYSPTLENPAGWSGPERLMAGGRWYAQVLGTEPGIGTDKIAGQQARFYVGGRSDYIIEFAK